MIKFFKIFLFTLLAVFLTCFGLIIITPTILSTPFFKKQIVKQINKRINGSIELQELNLSWFSNQSLTDLLIKDSDGNTILNIDSLSISEPLFKLLFNGLKSKHIEIKNLGLFLLGKKSNFNAIYNQKKGSMEIEGHGDNFKIPKTFLFLKNGINLKNPLEINCVLEPNFLNNFFDEKTVKFLNAVKLQIKVNTFLYSFNEEEKNNIDIEIFSLNKIDLNLVNMQQIFTLNSAKLLFFSNSLNLLKARFQTKLQDSFHAPFNMIENSNLDMETDISITERLHPKIRKIKAELNGEKISASLFIQADKDLLELSSTAFVNAISNPEYLNNSGLNTNFTTILSKIKGTINTQIKHADGEAYLDGTIDDGIFTLNSPLTIGLKITPELNNEVIEKVFPFLSDVKYTEKPILIKIHPKDFKILIPNFNVKNIEIGDGFIDFGKIYLKNKGQLRLIFNFLEKEPKDSIPVWITPVYFQIKDGNMNILRNDMLINDKYLAASWGDINFVKEKVDMTFAITSKTLEKILNLENLNPDLMLQIPYGGPLNHPKFDKKIAAARFSALLAQKQGVEKNLFGKFIEIASKKLVDHPIPSQTTTPFPWEDASEKENSLE